MANKQTPYFVGALVLLLVVLLYFFWDGGKGNYSWREHYDPNSKDPYGTYLVRNLLETYFPGQPFKVVKDSIGEQLDSGSFVYVGTQFSLDSQALDQLLRFVERGNRAFIACPYIPQALLDSLDDGTCGDYGAYGADTVFHETFHQIPDTVAYMNFLHPSLADTAPYQIKRLFLRQTIEHAWDFVPNEYRCEAQTTFTTLGLINDEHANFVSAAYGNGEFLLHTTPLAFTNLYLMEKRGLEYASKAFSHLGAGPIYWDERRYDPFDDAAGNGGSPEKQSPLRYILSQPPLAWAWYILLGMAVLYLVFRAKRRQRVIPVLERNANTSLEFIGTIGRLFFIQNNHRQLAAQKMRLFLIFVRERYHLHTKELNEAFTKGLAVRSDVPEEHITKIINLHRNITSSGFLSDTTLVDFHRLLERFYRECK